MNERIRLLAEQAGLLPKEIGPVVETRHMKKKEQDLEKFAELIVRECMAVSEDVANANGEGPWFEGYMSGVEEVTRRVKQHFGVEE